MGIAAIALAPATIPPLVEQRQHPRTDKGLTRYDDPGVSEISRFRQ